MSSDFPIKYFVPDINLLVLIYLYFNIQNVPFIFGIVKYEIYTLCKIYTNKFL